MIEALFCQDSLVWQILHCWENCVAENFYNWATRRHLHETSSLSNFWVSTKEVNGLVRYSAWGNYCYCPLFVHLYYFFYREGVLVWTMTNGHILCWSRGCHWVIFIFHCVCHCGSIITQLRSNLVAWDMRLLAISRMARKTMTCHVYVLVFNILHNQDFVDLRAWSTEIWLIFASSINR